MLEIEGSDGDCGSCCLFARSGETGNKGVPGEAGNLKTGSMRSALKGYCYGPRVGQVRKQMAEIEIGSEIVLHK